MPPVRARAAATILLSPVPRWLQEWHASPFELVCRPEALRHALLAAHVPPAVRETFAAARVTVDDVVHGLAAVAGDIDATLAQSALATHQRMCNELERLEHKTLKAVERREGELVARLQRAREIVAPGHALQERVVGIPALLARAGLDIAGPLLALLHQQEGRHLFVEL
jgi:uncharacterized protein YllA (UPF0747 family)